jgi:hypothetical protein
LSALQKALQQVSARPRKEQKTRQTPPTNQRDLPSFAARCQIVQKY